MKVKLSLSKARHLVTELQRETSSLKHKIFTESVVAVPAYASVFDDDYNKAVQAVATQRVSLNEQRAQYDELTDLLIQLRQKVSTVNVKSGVADLLCEINVLNEKQSMLFALGNGSRSSIDVLRGEPVKRFHLPDLEQTHANNSALLEKSGDERVKMLEFVTGKAVTNICLYQKEEMADIVKESEELKRRINRLQDEVREKNLKANLEIEIPDWIVELLGL